MTYGPARKSIFSISGLGCCFCVESCEVDELVLAVEITCGGEGAVWSSEGMAQISSNEGGQGISEQDVTRGQKLARMKDEEKCLHLSFI